MKIKELGDDAKQNENDDVDDLSLAAHFRRSKDYVLVDAIYPTIAFWIRYSTQLPWVATFQITN